MFWWSLALLFGEPLAALRGSGLENRLEFFPHGGRHFALLLRL